MKDVQFHASVRGRLEIGKKIFGKWVRLARMSGHVKGKSENANLDLILKWNDFKFVPTVSMNSNIVEAIERQVNPRLQKLKEKMISMGFAEYDIEWTVQNNILRVMVKPKSGKGSVSPVIPIDNMLCVNGNVLAVINAFPLRVKRAATTTGIEFTCVAPKFSCKGVSCSLCTDIDINPAAVNSTDKFHNCMPSF
ncbi:hypothetical protein NECAME_01216 [Necator americanus]|uniref:Uncharacterized protein n=1 Tax=Necator americanus TaxID=51031 RepID=W2TZG0_NECAM|nr:hypothetical protein NECAME_01216 [Necator americanus]ETN87059.1 hypothetical protein NECAME_01216 [Necator americanus]